jgi:AraC-like DNA-binding protein
MAAGMSRARQPVARWTGVVFDVSAAAYAIKLWNDETGILPSFIGIGMQILAFGTVGWFWLFVRALFEDRRSVQPMLLIPVLGPVVLSLIALQFKHTPFGMALFVLCALVRIGLALHILRVVTRSWTDDLVEVRRRLRGPFVLTVTAYILAISGLDLWEAFVGPVPMFPLVNSFVLAAVCLTGSFIFIEARDELFAAESPAALRPVARTAVPAAANGVGLNGASLDRAAKADLDRLQALMTTQQVWREEGLTVASLAVKAGMPETQLRRLISDCLGYRNFPSFVNAHRIAAAKTRLADPNEARVTVSTIAYDIGFASLGPFNRAFREETGVSPSEWRRQAMEAGSPIPEKA